MEQADQLKAQIGAGRKRDREYEGGDRQTNDQPGRETGRAGQRLEELKRSAKNWRARLTKICSIDSTGSSRAKATLRWSRWSMTSAPVVT
jgi:hypothetical protein